MKESPRSTVSDSRRSNYVASSGYVVNPRNGRHYRTRSDAREGIRRKTSSDSGSHPQPYLKISRDVITISRHIPSVRSFRGGFDIWGRLSWLRGFVITSMLFILSFYQACTWDLSLTLRVKLPGWIMNHDSTLLVRNMPSDVYGTFAVVRKHTALPFRTTFSARRAT